MAEGTGGSPGARPEHPDVHVVEVDGREIVLVGTAHISSESAALVREVVERERPDAVCVELDAQRHAALAEGRRFEALDLKQVMQRRQLAALIANLLLASYQKKLGGQLGVMPGAELLEASRAAEERGIPVVLCDRDVRVTLRRAWASMSFWKKISLAGGLLAASFEKGPGLDEAELRRLRSRDVLSELMAELGAEHPDLKRVLIDERDAYLAERIRQTPGERLVAVVGAGHVEGMLRALRGPRGARLRELESVAPVSPVWRWLGWGIPALIVGSLVAIGVRKGPEVAGANLLYWILANGIPSSLGAALALAHPLTVAAAFFVAPLTSLTPVIGAGYVLAFLQAWTTPPLVSDFETVAEDVGSPRRWWQSRLLRILLVFVLTTIGSLIGTYVGGIEIVSNLF